MTKQLLNKQVSVQVFPKVSEIPEIAKNVLRKRYLHRDETTWEDVVSRVIDTVLQEENEDQRRITYELINHRYFIPNSPCLVNAGISLSLNSTR